MKWMNVLSLALLVAVAGCARTQKPAETQDAQTAGDAAAPKSELRKRAEAISDVTRRLPGRNAGENQAMTADLFSQLADVLPTLQPAGTDGAFQQRVMILETSSQRLGASAEFQPEPTVNQGLRAACNALMTIAQQRFDRIPEIATTIDSAAGRVDQLNNVKGASHRLIASQAARDLSRALDLMVNAIETPAGG